jgi:outer membrane protein assembly factor BamB
VIFLTAYRSESNVLETLCIDAASGDIRWRKPCPEVEQIEKCHQVNNPAAPTPVTDGETVVVYFGSYGLLAYDFEGNELWHRPLPMARVFMNYGSGSSPIICGDRVILFESLGDDSCISAFHTADGSELWKTSRARIRRSWATPVVWRESGLTRVGLLSSRRFSAYDIADGKELWWVGNLATNTGSSPMVLDDRLLLTSAGIQGDSENILIPPDFETMIATHDKDGDGKIAFQEIPESVLLTDRQTSDGSGNLSLKGGLRFMGTKPDVVFDREGWRKMQARVRAFKEGPMSRPSATVVRTGGTEDVTESHRAWEEPRGVGEVSSPLVYRGLVYLIKNGGVLTVRTVETGEQVYVARLRRASGGYYATPVAAAGLIYFASDAGKITVIKAGPKLEIVSQCEIGEPIYATPAIAGNALYVRSKNQLYAFATR